MDFLDFCVNVLVEITGDRTVKIGACIYAIHHRKALAEKLRWAWLRFKGRMAEEWQTTRALPWYVNAIPVVWLGFAMAAGGMEEFGGGAPYWVWSPVFLIPAYFTGLLAVLRVRHLCSKKRIGGGVP